MKKSDLIKLNKQQKAGKLFYEAQYSDGTYTSKEQPQDHKEFFKLAQFLNDQNWLKKKPVLEVGSGKGLFKDLFPHYTGIDICTSLSKFYNCDKRYVVGSGKDLPFLGKSFHLVFSVQALEHIPAPEKVLIEMKRVLVDQGMVYLAPAWQCRPWAALGYPVRPYSDFSLPGKIIKFSIKFRDTVAWRSIFIFPKRVWCLMKYKILKKPIKLYFKKLIPNYKKKWMSDSDAVNSIDPFSVILWFVSRGDDCLNYKTLKKALFVRGGALHFRINKSNKSREGR